MKPYASNPFFGYSNRNYDYDQTFNSLDNQCTPDHVYCNNEILASDIEVTKETIETSPQGEYPLKNYNRYANTGFNSLDNPFTEKEKPSDIKKVTNNKDLKNNEDIEKVVKVINQNYEYDYDGGGFP